MKRIISILTFIVLLTMTISCASANDETKTSKPVLGTEDNKIIVNNAVPSGTLILAFYDDGVLVGVNTHNGSGTITADISTAPEGADKVKALYWDMKNITPLGNMIALPLNSMSSDTMKIRVASGDIEVIFELNDTSAAKSLYDQLPLTIDVENYGGNEKIFYPEKLDCSDVIEGDCPTGTLAYFSPWGDVVMYYAPASRYSGLYILGEAVEGEDNISRLSGTIEITKVKSR